MEASIPLAGQLVRIVNAYREVTPFWSHNAIGRRYSCIGNWGIPITALDLTGPQPQARVNKSSNSSVIACECSVSEVRCSPNWSTATETISSGCKTSCTPSTSNTGFMREPAVLALPGKALWHTSGTTVCRR